MTAQLALTVPAPGYYSCWAETRNRMAGSGGVTWHPDEESARAYAVASFDRGYRSWKPEQRPVAEVVRVELLVPGPDRGSWISLPDDVRYPHGKDAPWFPHHTQTTDRKATA